MVQFGRWRDSYSSALCFVLWKSTLFQPMTARSLSFNFFSPLRACFPLIFRKNVCFFFLIKRNCELSYGFYSFLKELANFSKAKRDHTQHYNLLSLGFPKMMLRVSIVDWISHKTAILKLTVLSCRGGAP